MNSEQVKDRINFILEGLRRPLYRDLEVGFRHSPLTQKEIIERYKETCDFAVWDLEELLKIL